MNCNVTRVLIKQGAVVVVTAFFLWEMKKICSYCVIPLGNWENVVTAFFLWEFEKMCSYCVLKVLKIIFLIIFGENGLDIMIEYHLTGALLQKLKIAKNVVTAFFLWGQIFLASPTDFNAVNPKRAGGAKSAPPLVIFCYISAGCYFFRAETSWLFFFKPWAQFKIIFKKIGPRVMTRRCVIELWVQWKTDQKLIFNGNYTQIVFFVFRIHFHYVLSYLFGLFGVRTSVSKLWHTSLPKKCNFAWKNSEKIAKNHDFGDFWWFSCFWHDVTYDVTVASYKVCLYFFWYQWAWEGHSYPLVPYTWYFVNRFPRS